MKVYPLHEIQTGRSVKLITEAKTWQKANEQLSMIMYIIRGMPGGEPVASMVSLVLFNILVNDLEEG